MAAITAAAAVAAAHGTQLARPAGVFKVDASGRGTLRVDPTGGPAAKFAVTLEPEAGVPAPTGPIVLASR